MSDPALTAPFMAATGDAEVAVLAALRRDARRSGQDLRGVGLLVCDTPDSLPIAPIRLPAERPRVRLTAAIAA